MFNRKYNIGAENVERTGENEDGYLERSFQMVGEVKQKKRRPDVLRIK